MNSFSTGMLGVLLSWVRSLASSLWNVFTDAQSGGLLVWIGENWKMLAILLCLTGLGVDLAVNLLRWQPLKVWSSFFRRVFSQHAPAPRTEPSPAWPGMPAEAEPAEFPEPDSAQESVTEYEPGAGYGAGYEAGNEPGYGSAYEPGYGPGYEQEYAQEALPEESAGAWAGEEFPDFRTEESPAGAEDGQPEEAGPVRRNRRSPRTRTDSALRGWVSRITGEAEEAEAQSLNWRGAQASLDKAYREPYIPPQWKAPEETAPGRRRRRSGKA